jgi:uncharacterized membrane protein
MEHIEAMSEPCLMTLLQARSWSGFVTSAGVSGFVGLLFVSSMVPDDATLLRTLALVWFFAFEIARFAFWRILPKRAGSESDRPATSRPIKPQPR